jgi:hypothetical protein
LDDTYAVGWLLGADRGNSVNTWAGLWGGERGTSENTKETCGYVLPLPRKKIGCNQIGPTELFYARTEKAGCKNKKNVKQKNILICMHVFCNSMAGIKPVTLCPAGNQLTEHLSSAYLTIG